MNNPTPPAAMPDEVIYLTMDEAQEFKANGLPVPQGQGLEAYVRKSIVTPEVVRSAQDEFETATITVISDDGNQEVHLRDFLPESVIETIRTLLRAHGGGE